MFYLKLLNVKPFQSAIVVSLGVISRMLTVTVFVLTFKVFLSIVQPESAEFVVSLLPPNLAALIPNGSGVLYVFLSLLFALVLAQLLFNKLYLMTFVALRTSLMGWLFRRPLCSALSTHIHISLDKFPLGFDGVIKSCEIIIFYLFLVSVILILNVFTGLLVIACVPMMLAIIIVKGRKEIYIQKDMNESRKEISSLEDDFEAYSAYAEKKFKLGIEGTHLSQLISGLALVLIMCLFLFYQSQPEQQNYVGITAIALVFSIRFAIVYAGELGRSLNKVIQQRVIVENIETSPF